MLSRIFNSKLFDTSDLRNAAAVRPRELLAVVLCALVLTVVAVLCRAAAAHLFPRDPRMSETLRQIGPDVDVVVLGTSQVMLGIKPDAYPLRVLPIAASMMNARFSEVVWDAHAQHLSRVSLVLLEFDLGTLFVDTSRRNPYAAVALGAAAWPGVGDFARDFDGAVRWLLAPLFENRLTPRYLHLSQLTFRAKRGALAVTARNPEETAARKAAEMNALIDHADPRVVADNRAAIVALAAKLSARGVPLRLVRLPLEPAAREKAGRAREALAAQLHLARSEGLPESIPFVDFADDESFAASDFYDSNHLNERGAARLAPKLALATMK